MYNQVVNINLGVNMNNLVTVPQYSTGLSFSFYIDNYTLTNNSEAKIFIKKPSGHEVLCTCSFVNNRITVPCLL